MNDPLTWSPSNFITAESFGDGLKKIARSGSYIVAFGGDSIEFFYDAANPTGSPLSVYQGATKRIGYLGGLASIGDALFFVGKASGGTPTLYKIEGLKVTAVTDFTQSRSFQVNFDDALTFAAGNFVFLNGHTVYVWRTFTDDYLPICYDLDTELFISLSFQDLDCDLLQSTSFTFDGGGTSSLFCRQDDNKVYFYDSTVYQDDGVNYTVMLQTNNEDFDSRRNKFASRALIHADQTSSDSNVQINWTVDDYQTFTTARSVNLNDVYPATHALGLFRKIAFKLEYTDNFPMRFIGVELDYNIGNQ